MNKRNNIILIAAAVVILVGGASFYGGTRFNKFKQSRNVFNRDGSGFQQRQGQGMVLGGGTNRANRGGNFINGEIIKKDEKTITVKLADGGSKNIYVTDKTTYGKFIEGSEADLEIGKSIMVNGATNQDGSFLAQMVQIRPEDMRPATSTQR